MNGFDTKTKLIIVAGMIGYIAIGLWSAAKAFNLSRRGELEGRGWTTVVSLSALGVFTLALLLLLK